MKIVRCVQYISTVHQPFSSYILAYPLGSSTWIFQDLFMWVSLKIIRQIGCFMMLHIVLLCNFCFTYTKHKQKCLVWLVLNFVSWASHVDQRNPDESLAFPLFRFSRRGTFWVSCESGVNFQQFSGEELMRKVDPQLLAVREAAQKRFLAQKATTPQAGEWLWLWNFGMDRTRIIWYLILSWKIMFNGYNWIQYNIWYDTMLLLTLDP